MVPADIDGERLSALDAQVEAFSTACASRIELGARLARDDVAHLAGLAGAIAVSLADWGRRIEGLEVGRRAAFDDTRARALVLESVCDEILTPEAWRVLAAALDRATAP